MGRTISIRFKDNKIDKITGSKDPQVLAEARLFGELMTERGPEGDAFRKQLVEKDAARQAGPARTTDTNQPAPTTRYKFTPEEARAGGKKGGSMVSQDREHMRRIRSKGGRKTAQDPEHMRAIGRKGGAKTASDRERMSELGKLGGAAKAANAKRGET